MADPIDLSDPAREQFLADSIAKVPRPGGVSAFICVDCEDPIPERRRQAYQGTIRCVECQAEYARFLKIR
jgi:phage/conjugal plasmid C-4 type zinc finger TraR family protein